MRDFDQIEVSSGRRLRALAVAGIATVALVAAGISYLHPRLALPAPPAKPKPAPSFQAVAPQRPITVKQLLYADGSLWFVYEARGLTEVYRSPSSGLTWSHVYEGPAVGDIEPIDGMTAMVPLGQLTMLVSDRTAVTIKAPIGTGLAISYGFAGSLHGLALLTDGRVFETQDEGDTWHQQEGKGIPAAGIKHDLGVTAGGRAWFLDATDSGEFLYLSEDWGRSWRELTPPGLGGSRNLNLAALGEQLIAWYPSRAFRLLPRNASWDEVSPPPASGPLSLRPDGEFVLAVGREVYRLDASAWTPLPAPAPEAVWALAAGDRDQLFAAGESGSLYSFIGETREWLRLPSPFQYQWMAVPNSP